MPPLPKILKPSDRTGSLDMLDKLKEIVTNEIEKLHTKSTDSDLSNEDFNTLFMLTNQVERIRVMENSPPTVPAV